MRKTILMITVSALALSLAACGKAPASSQPMASSQQPAASSSVAQPALGSFTAVDIYGNEVTADIFTGKKLTLVNVWGTFCSPCIQEMPDLGALAAEYEATDVQIIGVAMDTVNGKGTISEKTVETAKEIVEKTGAHYLHLIPSSEWIEAKLGNITAVPTTFFVDEKGNIVGKDIIGAQDKATWKATIEAMLKEVQ